MKKTAIALLVSLSAAGSALAQTQTTETATWAERLQQDAQAIHQSLSDNHPGPVDPLNPGFQTLVDDGLAEALSRAEYVTDHGGWWWALRAYIAKFQDGHVNIGMKDRAYEFPTRWPGFLTRWSPAGYVVSARKDDEGLPPKGARLIGCDGLTADQLAAQRIGQFRGRWFLESQKQNFRDQLFLNASNPYLSDLETCQFEIKGKTQSYNLTWTLDTEGVNQALQSLNPTAYPAIEMVQQSDQGWWIATPSFDGSTSGVAYPLLNGLLEEMRAEQDSLRAAPYIVLDLRGNGGGSSHWSQQMAQILWGEDYIAQTLPSTNVFIDWRASAANLATLQAYLSEAIAGNADPRMIEWARAGVEGLSAARARGADYWRQGEASEESEAEAPTTSLIDNPVKGKVFILTDSGCASACLDAVDLWKLLGAVQIGRETSADTVYMELRRDDLPSGMAVLAVPMKVYRGRLRGNNEPHRPEHIFDFELTDDARVREAISSLVAAR